VHEEHHPQKDRQRGSDALFPSAEAARQAASRRRQHAQGPLFVAQLARDGASEGWLVLSAEELAAHPRRQELTTVGRVDPPLAEQATVEVTITMPGTQDVLSLGSMDPTAAMSLLDILQGAAGLVRQPREGADQTAQERPAADQDQPDQDQPDQDQPDQDQPDQDQPDQDPPAATLPAPSGYEVLLDGARPGHLTVRLTFGPRRFSDMHSGHEDLATPGGDAHSGPASLVVLLDHWAEEHGYRFIHTADNLNQPIEEYLSQLEPEDRQRVVIALEEDDEGGLVRIGEAMAGTTEIVEVAALSTDWLASLPRAT
jgi:hypothetical protein